MGTYLSQLADAFLVAAIVTALELITTKYPRTPAFVLRSLWFRGYVMIYGFLATAAYALLPIVSDQVTITGVGLSNPWIKAALVGFSVKAFLHIRVFTVSTGPGQSFPVGLETFVQIFEPWMLRNLELDHFNRLMEVITPLANRYADVAAARQRAINNIPNTFSNAERVALTADINLASTSTYVIIAYLNYVGIKAVRNAFP
ncbi:MAG: hypothetical protein ACHQRJ_02245 [Alphaproteobacteria bacterium]